MAEGGQLHRAREPVAEAECATTVVVHVACDAIVGGLASIADRPHTAGRRSDPPCLRTLMFSVGSGRSAGCTAGGRAWVGRSGARLRLTRSPEASSVADESVRGIRW